VFRISLNKNNKNSPLCQEFFLAFFARFYEFHVDYLHPFLSPKFLMKTHKSRFLKGRKINAGLGGSCVVPYHDAHFSIGHSLHQGSPFIDDRQLRREGVIRITDILFDYGVLLSTDGFFSDRHSQSGVSERDGYGVRIDILRDVHETAALVLDAKRRKEREAKREV
jgi:hypothetical protein